MSTAVKPISPTYELARLILHLDTVAPQLMVRSVEGEKQGPVLQISCDELASIAYDLAAASCYLKRLHRTLTQREDGAAEPRKVA